mgnify:CR=1 FL=1
MREQARACTHTHTHTHTLASQFLVSLLKAIDEGTDEVTGDVTDDSSAAFLQRLSLPQLGTKVIQAFLHAVTELQRQPQLPLAEDCNSDPRCLDAIVCFATTLMLWMSELYGSREVGGLLRSEVAKIPGRAAAVHALLEGAEKRKHPDVDLLLNEIAVGCEESSARFAPPVSASASGGSVKSGAGSSAKQGGGSKAGKTEKKCASCGCEGKLKVCSRCNAAWFCDSTCQRAAWPSHRAVCVPQGAAGQ